VNSSAQLAAIRHRSVKQRTAPKNDKVRKVGVGINDRFGSIVLKKSPQKLAGS
jgi:hypothetical protein